MLGEMASTALDPTDLKPITGIMSIEYRLDCGCRLHHACRTLGSLSSKNIPSTFDHQTKALAYWLATRVPRHRCDLVSSENPNGIAPRAAHEA